MSEISSNPENCDLWHQQHGGCNSIAKLEATIAERDKIIEELEAKIERMKRCENCLHGRTYCKPKIGLCTSYDKWEEKDER